MTRYNPATYPEDVVPSDALPRCSEEHADSLDRFIEPGAPFGDETPWGNPQSAYQIASGIWHVTTARHGGLWVAPRWLDVMPPLLRLASLSNDEWFEEDCAASAIYMAFPGLHCISNGLFDINDALPEEHQVHVCRSANGYYLGRRNEHGEPISRESVEYWPTRSEAQEAFEDATWTLRKHY